MNFESLPNEIFLDFFDYFDGTDLLRAFYGLNFRFNYLLCKQYQTFRFNFKSISKRQFDIICQQHFPFIGDRVITLSLSNNDDTPQQIDLFCSYISSVNQFVHLRSLSLSHIHIYAVIMKIIDQCHRLCHFTHLKFDLCHLMGDRMHYQSIIDNIWSLPKLIHCENDIVTFRRFSFCAPTRISSSLERLSLISCKAKLNQINQLCEYTPSLKHLSISVADSHDDYQPSLLPMLINLNIVFHTFDISEIVSLLQNMPNLYRLNIDLSFNIIDGYQWEEMIRNYLPKLKTFQLKMKDALHSDQNIEELINELIDPFRSSFWREEHQWFVRCFACRTTVYLCTLSNTFQSYNDKLPDLFVSTHPHDDLQSFCNDMTEIADETFFDYLIPSNIRFTNIKYLMIQFPIHNQFWSIVPSLNKLHSLTVYVNIDTSQSQLQALLDRAIHLDHLSIYNDTSLPLQMSLFKHINLSIRRLDIKWCESCSSEEECIALTRSPLAVQCEVLFIQVYNRDSILTLLYNMINLRALSVRCEEEIFTYRLLRETDTNSWNKNVSHRDEVVQWLKERLPSTYLIAHDTEVGKTIHIWI